MPMGMPSENPVTGTLVQTGLRVLPLNVFVIPLSLLLRHHHHSVVLLHHHHQPSSPPPPVAIITPLTSHINSSSSYCSSRNNRVTAPSSEPAAPPATTSQVRYGIPYTGLSFFNRKQGKLSVGTIKNRNRSYGLHHTNKAILPPKLSAHPPPTNTNTSSSNTTNGLFRLGIHTALVGVSSAGKTTLTDVLDGRKTRGYIDGRITISGYPKKQSTFARVSGYHEQNYIHSPHITVYESLVHSLWLRMHFEVDTTSRKEFVDDVIELVELFPVRESIVGLPGTNGLSTEQRKRLTIAVELVANPSITFMDEPISGVDARAAAIVMRGVKNTIYRGRTIVCTIHQPSIDISESFDELYLMRQGGEEIYVGPLDIRNISCSMQWVAVVPCLGVQNASTVQLVVLSR